MKKVRHHNLAIFFIYAMFSWGIFISFLFAAQQEPDLITPQEYKAETFRDPFKSYLVKEDKENIVVEEEDRLLKKDLPSLIVQGIIWGGKIPQAIINNKVVKAGDTIEEVKIIAISKKGITVSFAGQEYNLSSPAESGPVEKSKPSQKYQGGLL